MMLARVADSLHWLGRYGERAEHVSRLSSVMLNAALDRTDAADQAARIALAALGAAAGEEALDPMVSARTLVLDREWPTSVINSLASARENARQIRDQLTTEAWERLNMLYLRATGVSAQTAFADDAPDFLQRIIADLHLFKGAADTTMSHGDGWRFLLTGVYVERAQLIARLLRVCFGGDRDAQVEDHVALVNLLRMACALEPYLRVYTADINARFILEFLMFDEDFPRSIRFCTARLQEHLRDIARGREPGRSDPVRVAGRLHARLAYADIDEVEAGGAGDLLGQVLAECTALEAAIHDTFVAYPLEARLPA